MGAFRPDEFTPTNELEQQYKDSVASEEASKMIRKYMNNPELMKRVATQFAEYALNQGKKTDNTDNE